MSIRSSEEYEKQGVRLLQAEQPADALQVFEEGMRRFPGDEDLTMGAAMAYLRLGDGVRSCAILEDLRRAQPRSTDVRQALVEAYLSREMLADAVRAAAEAADIGRNDARLLSRLGRAFYSRRFYREALPLYEAAAAAAPDWSEAWFGIGACQWALKRPARAEQTLRRAVQLEPTDWQARQFLGCVLCDIGRKEEAREILESIPLDVSWQKPALERLVAMSWWPEDAERARKLERLWRQVMDGEPPRGALDILDEVSRKMDGPS